MEIVGHLVAFQHHTQKLPGKGALVRIAVGDITVDIGIYCGLWFIKREIKIQVTVKIQEMVLDCFFEFYILNCKSREITPIPEYQMQTASSGLVSLSKFSYQIQGNLHQ